MLLHHSFQAMSVVGFTHAMVVCIHANLSFFSFSFFFSCFFVLSVFYWGAWMSCLSYKKTSVLPEVFTLPGVHIFSITMVLIILSLLDIYCQVKAG